jgi:hypothetical protein
MTLKQFKKLISHLNQNSLIKVNGSDIQLTFSVDQDNNWYINITELVNTTALDSKFKDEH